MRTERSSTALLPSRTAIAAVMALSAGAASAQAPSAADLYARLEPSVWVVRTFDKDDLPLAQGSAVVIASQTLVTNCHVLRKAKRVEVTHEKLSAPATLELWDTARDLCQLRAPTLKAAPVALAEPGSVKVGQAVYALGTPAGMELTLSTGIVSALRHDDTRRLTAIQTSAAISQGSSGGGLFDDQGRLIGITTAFIGGNAQNLNLALPVEMVRELPERHQAAQAAKQGGSKTTASTAPAPVPRAADARGNAGAPAPVVALAGQWSGDYRCGAYLGAGKVANMNGWTVPAMMNVAGDGTAVLMRGDSSYSESLAGEVRQDLSTTLKGRGAMKGKQEGSWTTELTGRFVGTGADTRFDGEARIGSAAGDVTRQCTVTLTKNTTG